MRLAATLIASLALAAASSPLADATDAPATSAAPAEPAGAVTVIELAVSAVTVAAVPPMVTDINRPRYCSALKQLMRTPVFGFFRHVRLLIELPRRHRLRISLQRLQRMSIRRGGHIALQ